MIKLIPSGIFWDRVALKRFTWLIYSISKALTVCQVPLKLCLQGAYSIVRKAWQVNQQVYQIGSHLGTQ